MTNRTLTGFLWSSRRGIRFGSLCKSKRERSTFCVGPRTIQAVIGAVMVVTSIGCGDQSSPAGPSQGRPTSTGPATPDPSLNIVPAAHDGVVGVYKFDVTITRSGTATATLSWPDADFSLQLYLTSGACADTTSLLTGGCKILGVSGLGNPPVTVTIPVNRGDMNTVWVVNRDPLPQNFTVDIQIE